VSLVSRGITVIRSCSVYIFIYTYSHEQNNIAIDTNTCFGPLCKPSSDCSKYLLSDYTVCVVIFEGETRSRLTSQIVGLVKVANIYIDVCFIMWMHRCSSDDRMVRLNKDVNLLAPELFFLILAHTVYKMWITREPNKLELWSKLHFEENETGNLHHV